MSNPSERGRGGRGRGDRGRGDRGRGDRGRGGFGRGDEGRSFDRGGYGRGDGGSRGRGSDRGGSFRGGRGGGPMEVQVFRQGTGEPRADEQVARKEDAYQASLQGVSALQRLTTTDGYPSRPGFGTKGEKVLLWANYIHIVPRTNLTLYRYSLTCRPDAKGKKLGRIIELALQAPELSTVRDDIVTDFRSNIVSQQDLGSTAISVPVRYRGDGEDEPAENAVVYTVEIQYTRTLPVSELIEYITSTSTTAPFESTEFVQAFNIFLNHYSRSQGNQAQIGSTKTFSLSPNAATTSLGAGLAAIRGFFSSVRVATCRLLVNVNVSHGAFYEAGLLTDLMFAYSRSHRNDNFALNKFLTKLAIRTTHLPRKINSAGQEVYRVKRVTSLATPGDGQGQEHRPKVKFLGAGSSDVEFWLDEARPSTGSQPKTKPQGKGKKKQSQGPPAPGPSTASGSGSYITVAKYFETRYQIRLKQPQLPVINVGNRQSPVYLPPEVCIVMPGQNSNTKLDPTQTQEMIRFAVRRPWQNATSIVQEGIQMVGLDPTTNRMLEHFGINVAGQLITVPGRVLNSPKIQYRGNKAVNTRFGSWNLLDVAFSRAGTLKVWSCVFISMGAFPSPLDAASVSGMTQSLYNNLRNTGITVDAPLNPNPLTIDSPDDPRLDTMFERAAQRLTLLFVILPTASTPLYNRIKYLGDIKYGIHTVCSIGSKLVKQRDRGLDQYFANVALKINLKLGGCNHSLDNSRMPLIAEGKTILVGIDVTHPSPGSSSGAPSVAGVVASVDKLMGQFPAALAIQEARKESVVDLRDMIKSRLVLWRSHSQSRALPENIVIYRDGVSEGQYDKVINEELPQVRAAAQELYTAPQQKAGLPRITIIVVGKRHHTRFYPATEKDADRGSNTKPGTVVDRGVTQAQNWDFFLQPHAALQGTARPGHYYVILDEVFRQHYTRLPPGGAYQNVADVVEEFTHSLCYMFGRATKAVSLCPPAYYADIVCERARCYLSRVFETPTPSVAGSTVGGSGQGQAVGQEDVRIHDRLKNSMFYI